MDRFIIAGTQRTGTSLIVSTLASHPDISCLGEVFLFQKGRGKRIEGSYRQFINQKRLQRSMKHYLHRQQLVHDYLDQLYRSAATSATGFKFMLSQARAFPEAVSYMQKNHIKVLHVIRENVLKTLVSRISAKSRKLYHAKENINVDKIHLSPRKLMSRLDHIQNEIADWKRLAAENPYTVITYEGFVANREAELYRALGFLGLNYSETMSSRLRKINPDNLIDVIENFDQVVSILRGTQYEQYLGLE